ncbi:unnamed protein product [Calypogeia fissa]
MYAVVGTKSALLGGRAIIQPHRNDSRSGAAGASIFISAPRPTGVASLVHSVNIRPRRSLHARLCVVRATLSTTELSGTFAIEGIDVLEGTGGLPKIRLHNKDKSEAEIYLHGGVITSWKSQGTELLHIRPDAVFDGVKPISGGMPHCFPQFGPGALQQHGFGRNVSWSVASSSNENDTPSVTLELRDGEYSRGMWDYKFLVKYTISLEAEKLKTELVVKNVDQKHFSFTTALHSYFSAKIEDVVITGLNGLKALDKHPVTKEPVETEETRDLVTFGGFVDRVYLDAPKRVVLRNGLGKTIAIENEGWPDAVVWNPYQTMKNYYKDFVCIENATVKEAMELQPGESWTAKTQFGVE